MSEKLYAWLLKLYPSHFRRDYGASAMQLFRDRLQAEQGIVKTFRLWLDVIADLAISIPREHRRRVLPEPVPEGSFQLSVDAVTEITKRKAILPLVFFGLFVLLGLSVGLLGKANPTLLCAAYSVLALVTIARFGSIRKFEQRWLNYHLTVTTDRIQRQQEGNVLTLLRSEVVKINEDQNGLTVIGRREQPIQVSGVSSIWIPAGLTDYEQVKSQLSQWTEHFSQRRALWFTPRPVFACVLSLIPALLLARSTHWFLVLSVLYYGLIVLAIMMHVIRPPRDSGLRPRARGLNVPQPAYMWRRFKHVSAHPAVLIMACLPLLRFVILTA